MNLKIVKLRNNGEMITPVVNVYLNLFLFWSNKWPTFLLICIIPLYMIIPQMIYIFAHIDDIKEALDALCPVAACIVTNMKTWLCYWKKEKIRILLNELQFEWNESVKSIDTVIQQTIVQTRKFCTIMSLVYGIWFIIVCIIYSLFPIGQFFMYAMIVKRFPANYTMDFPYKSQFPYSVDSNFSFTCTYMIIMIGVYVLAFGLAGFDTLFILLAYHVIIQLKFLNYDILGLRQYLTEVKQSPILNREIKRIIRRHIKCTELIYALEDTFNLFIMVQLASSSVVLCIVSFQFLVEFGLNPTIIKLIGYLLGSVLQLYIICWVSDEIKQQAANVSRSIYEIPWYNGTIDFQQLIRMIMLRAQKPMTVTAAKFYLVSFDTFKMIVMTSYSYFTLLQTVYYRN